VSVDVTEGQSVEPILPVRDFHSSRHAEVHTEVEIEGEICMYNQSYVHWTELGLQCESTVHGPPPAHYVFIEQR
jgi:hypothetical protein